MLMLIIRINICHKASLLPCTNLKTVGYIIFIS